MGCSVTENIEKEVLITNTYNPEEPIQMSKLLKAVKSICKIEYDNHLGSGFLIKLFRGEEDFFCLITNEHVITKNIINQRKTIRFYYDCERKIREIDLFPNERYIKDFREIDIDAIVIEILSADNIPESYFLIPSIDYMYNSDGLLKKK